VAVSAVTTFNLITNMNAPQNIYGLIKLNNITSINTLLKVSGITSLKHITSIDSSLNVSGITVLNNDTTINRLLKTNTWHQSNDNIDRLDWHQVVLLFLVLVV
jgi:hypothetical protein